MMERLLNPGMVRASFFLTATALFVLSGCDRSPTESENGHGNPDGLELVDRSTGELLAYTDVDHWHGSLTLEASQEVAVNTVFLDEDGHEIHLGGEYTVRTEWVTGEDGGIVSISDHGDHVDIDALAPGQVQVRFLLWHGGHADWASPAFTITVTEAVGDPSDIARVELHDRDTGEELGHTDGVGAGMHWDGDLPHLHPGDELEVNVTFKDSQGRVVPLGGEYTVNAQLAPGSPAGVVELDPHGDHVDIEAIGEGEVEIIFSLWHDDHSEFDAPPIALEVDAHDD